MPPETRTRIKILTGTVAPRAASGRDLRRVGGHSIGGMCRRGADGTPLMEGDARRRASRRVLGLGSVQS